MRRRTSGFNRRRISTSPEIVRDLQARPALLLPRKFLGRPLDEHGLSERDGPGDFWDGFLLTPVQRDLFVAPTEDEMLLVVGRRGIYVPRKECRIALKLLLLLALQTPDTDASAEAQERQRASSRTARDLLVRFGGQARVKRVAQAMHAYLAARPASTAHERDAAIRATHHQHPEWSQRRLARVFRVDQSTVSVALNS
jgi:hypothetical protein